MSINIFLEAATLKTLSSDLTLDADGSIKTSTLITDSGSGPLELGTTGVPTSIGTGDVYIGSKLEVSNILFSSNHFSNTFIGAYTGLSITSGMFNTNLGAFSGEKLATASYCTNVGYWAGGKQTGGANCINIGYRAGNSNLTSSHIVAIGNSALVANLAANNIAIGTSAAEDNVSGQDIVAIGRSALASTTASSQLVALGSYALTNADGSVGSVALGLRALSELIDGDHCFGLGWLTGYYNQNGSYNIWIGSSAGLGVSGQSNSRNIGIGYESMKGITTGNGSIALGYQSAISLTSGGGNIIIGDGIDVSSPTVSNELNIGNVIRGAMAADELFLSLPTSAPANASLNNNEISFWYDSTGPSIEVKHKDGSGTVRNGTVCTIA